MESVDPITILAVLGTAATLASAGASVYSLTRGTPEAPSLPEIPAPVAAPTAASPTAAAPTTPDLTKPTPTVAESARAQESALALRRRQGRASTILTGTSGLYSSGSTSSPLKNLLGE